MFYKGPQKLKGFTMLELLVVIFIITIGIMAIYAAVQYPLIYTTNSVQRFSAAYLAQEGIELVRNIRDANVLNIREWKTGLTGCVSGCEIDYLLGVLTPWVNPGQFLRVDNANGYSYSSANNTKFKRKITITTGADPDGKEILIVSVLVQWNDRVGPSQFEAKENLYQWWPPPPP